MDIDRFALIDQNENDIVVERVNGNVIVIENLNIIFKMHGTGERFHAINLNRTSVSHQRFEMIVRIRHIVDDSFQLHVPNVHAIAESNMFIHYSPYGPSKVIILPNVSAFDTGQRPIDHQIGHNHIRTTRSDSELVH